MIKNSAVSTSPAKLKIGGLGNSSPLAKKDISTADWANKGTDWIIDALGGDSSSGWGQSLSGVVGGVAGYFTGDWGGMIDSGGDFWGGIEDYTEEGSGLSKMLGSMESSSHAVGNYMQGDLVGGAKWSGEALRDTGDLFKEDSNFGQSLTDLGDESDELVGKVGVQAVNQSLEEPVETVQNTPTGPRPIIQGSDEWKAMRASPLTKKNKSIGDKKSTTMMLAVSHNPNTYGSMFGTK